MTIIRYREPLEILLTVKGHPFARDPFFAIFDALPGIACSAVDQPAAQAFFCPDLSRQYDAFVLYDMPGIEFVHGSAPVFHEPSTAFRRGFVELLAEGQGMVFLHHSIAAWPTWEEYAEIVGGRFLYQAGSVRGEPHPDSGYQLDVQHRVRIEDPSHPVVSGLEADFEIVDEAYLCPIFEDSVVPLLRSDASYTDEHFYSSDQAVRGRMNSREGWSHPRGSNLVGWAKGYLNSPIVYLALGDGPSAYANPAFRKLIENAIRWVASDEAHSWARSRPKQP